jgi:hypothetical protein
VSELPERKVDQIVISGGSQNPGDQRHADEQRAGFIKPISSLWPEARIQAIDCTPMTDLSRLSDHIVILAPEPALE